MRGLNRAGMVWSLVLGLGIVGIVCEVLAADQQVAQSVAPAAAPAVAPEIPTSKLPMNIQEITVPPRYGSVIETHEVPGSDKLIIHIQDAHTNYSAQKNLAEIIREIARRHHVELVLTEGGAGDVDLTSFKQEFPLFDNRQWRELADRRMKVGLLAGEEYVDLTDETVNLQLVGLEDMGVYEEGYHLFEQLHAHQAAIQDSLKQLANHLEVLKRSVYGPQLLALDEKRQALEGDKLTLTDYYIALDDQAKQLGVDLSGYPNVMNFIAAGKIEPSINFDQVNEERTTLLEQLTAKLPEEQMDALLGKSVDFRTGKIKQSEYYAHLLKAAQAQQDVPADSYLALAHYGEYVTLVDKIKMNELATDVDRLEAQIREKLFRNDDERQLGQIAKHAQLYRDLVEIKLSPAEYEDVQTHRADFAIGEWLPFLNAKAAQYQVVPISGDVAQVDQQFATLLAFYENARKRDEVFFQVATDQMQAQGRQVAMLVAGGFHTPQLTRLIREAGISYLVIAPKVDEETNMAQYRNVVSRRFESWKQRSANVQ